MIAHAIRARRFESRDGAHIILETADASGAPHAFTVVNASLAGLLAAVEGPADTLTPALEPGQILPEARLRNNGHQHDLGRLAVRRLEEHDGWTFIAFSCVDGRVPLYGDLGRHFHVDRGNEDPFAMEVSTEKVSLANFADAPSPSGDLFQKCRAMRLFREAMQEAHTYHYYGIRRTVDKVHVRMTLPLAKRPQKYVNFASYDYLGLSSDPEVRAAAQQTIEKFGVSATATPPNGGNSHHHEELEDTLARMLRKEAALVFTSGFAANVGCLTALLNTGDLAVADFYSHASIQDGLAAAKGETKYFRHNDMDHLDRTLTELRPKHNGVLTLTEGLFSMDGDAADLRRFIEVSRAHGAQTFIDEVHSFGIAGPGGLGFAERDGVLDDFDLYIGSLSKGIGAGGGFVAASRDVIHYLRFAARMELFSSALPPCLAAAALKSLEIVRNDPSRRRKLHENTLHFKEGLAEMGYALNLDPESPIIPLIIGDPQRMAAMNDVLIQHHIFTNLMIFPAVPLDQCRFRFMVSANHSFADIELALAALRAAMNSVDLRPQERPIGVAE